jgi:CheY-like chemotaxis protein
LLIDDDPDVRQVTATLLADFGCCVVEAASGRAGLAALERMAVVDVAVVDFAMPGMTGIEVADIIGAKRPTLPVVIITGYADADLAGAPRGRLHLLKKPFLRGELAATLLAATGHGGSDPGNVVRLHPAASP